jgi:hypothetical protein
MNGKILNSGEEKRTAQLRAAEIACPCSAGRAATADSRALHEFGC